MSVVGIDLGNYKSVVAVARNRGIDIVTNEVSNRFTPSQVGFLGKQRLLGEAAKSQEVMNSRNTVGSFKRLLGREFAEPEVLQVEKTFVSCELVDDKGLVGAKVNYNEEETVFSMVQAEAMYLTNMKKIAEAALNTPVSDVVLSVPAYYTDRQRHALINSASVAGLNVLRLMNESAAAALVYGITRARELPEKEPRHVVFVDIGHSAMTVSVVAFTQEKAVIKATTFDRNLGGRNFDEALVKHFANEIKTKHKVDVLSRPKALLRLQLAAEKVKKMLSANAQAPLNIENLTDDIDVNSIVTRETFEGMIADVIARLEAPLQAAMQVAGLSKEQIDFVELIGGSCRVPSIKSRISAFFGNKEQLLSTTLNLDEAVARGCAFQCAMISPMFKVREYELKDVVAYDIKVAYQSTTEKKTLEQTIFKAGDALPSVKQMTLARSEPFQIDAHYANGAQLPAGSNLFIGNVTINAKPGKDGQTSDVQIRVKVNPSGILTIENAQLVEELPEEATDGQTEPMKVDGAEGEQAQPADAAAASAAGADADKKEEAKKKRKVRKTDLPIHAKTSSLPESVVQDFKEKEVNMITSDKLIADTLEKKNNLEEYVYDMRGKVEGSHAEYITAEDKTKLLALLQQTEDWLYDEGENATKSVFMEKLGNLKKLGDPVEERYQENENRSRFVDELKATFNEFRILANTTDEKYAHIDDPDRNKILRMIESKEEWLSKSLKSIEGGKKTELPAVRNKEFATEKEALAIFARTIMNKPKPKPVEPPKQEAPPPAKPESDKMETDSTPADSTPKTTDMDLD